MPRQGANLERFPQDSVHGPGVPVLIHCLSKRWENAMGVLEVLGRFGELGWAFCSPKYCQAKGKAEETGQSLKHPGMT